MIRPIEIMSISAVNMMKGIAAVRSRRAESNLNSTAGGPGSFTGRSRRSLLAVSHGSTINRRGQLLERKVFGRFDKLAVHSSRLVRHQKGGCIVQTLPECLLAEDLIALRIRSALELRKHLVVRLVFSDGSRRCLIVFQEHQISQERLHRRLESPFFVRPPEIVSVADRFLYPIVEVISVGRSGLRFDFDAGKKIVVRDRK